MSVPFEVQYCYDLMFLTQPLLKLFFQSLVAKRKAPLGVRVGEGRAWERHVCDRGPRGKHKGWVVRATEFICLLKDVQWFRFMLMRGWGGNFWWLSFETSHKLLMSKYFWTASPTWLSLETRLTPHVIQFVLSAPICRRCLFRHTTSHHCLDCF